MADAAEPMRGMEITDSSLEELVRPLLLEFQPKPEAGEFAQMLPNRAILAALKARAQALGIPFHLAPVDRFRIEGSRIIAEAAGNAFSARLLVAADGRGSKLRNEAGIAYFGWSYPQTAIVGTIRHSLPHDGIAVQHFLPSGPFAMLPLKGGYESSIVWSEAPEAAARYLAGDPGDLLQEVDLRAAGRFGTITAFEGVQAFPLSLGIARSFVGPRLALLGDAAHGMHPIAGQGLNYGLRGAAALAETILDAARLGLDIGSEAALAPYESGRRPDVMAMALATESLNRLFSTDLGPVRMIRDIGLGLVNRVPGLKRRIMAEARGAGRLAPRAFRGETV
jgi:2-octaprenyl-6-methoxyphenol hydroxylase